MSADGTALVTGWESMPLPTPSFFLCLSSPLPVSFLAY
jgi:hypothetical protein